MWCYFETDLFVFDGVEAGRLDLVAVSVEPHVTQHHDGAQQQSSGVRHVHPSNVRGSAVNLDVIKNVATSSFIIHKIEDIIFCHFIYECKLIICLV